MRVSLILRAVATSWVAVVANASVGIFLTPYVLHRLGDEAFGVWVLIVNLVGYYGILDAGVRSAILRYVDRKSTRLNSSHGYISYAVFCLKKKKTNINN